MESKQDLGRLVLNLANTIIHNRNQHLEALGLTSSQADCMKFLYGFLNRCNILLPKNSFGIKDDYLKRKYPFNFLNNRRVEFYKNILTLSNVFATIAKNIS